MSTALLVGYEDQDNLGLRSIAATLEANGHEAPIVPYVPGDASTVVEAARTLRPALIGLSVIFQYTIDGFAELADQLRQAEVPAHITVGGHFPSLRPQEVLLHVPAFDSVVRFEGELTALELLQHIGEPETWSTIPGLVYREDGEMVINPPRPLIADLDELPPPVRGPAQRLCRGVRVSSILASRGCWYDCSFCSIRQFYGVAPGPLRRTRSPGAVIAEMAALHERDGVRFFIFQDDDFAARTPQQRAWIGSLLDEMAARGLSDKVTWRMACRVDEVDEALLRRCQAHGMVEIYLGVESGNDASLRALNKHVTAAQNVAAIEMVKRLGLHYDMGFMLFQPESTLETVREDIAFLRHVAGDGSCPLTFNRMLPYAGTPVEARLRAEGRLEGTWSQPVYRHLDTRLDWLSSFVETQFYVTFYDQLGLVDRLRRCWFDLAMARAYEPGPWVDAYEAAIREITARCNVAILYALERALSFVERRDVDGIAADWHLLDVIAGLQRSAEARIQADLDRVLAQYAPEVLASFQQEYQARFGG